MPAAFIAVATSMLAIIQIVSHLGGDPTRHVAMGGAVTVRSASPRFGAGIEDVRKTDMARVAQFVALGIKVGAKRAVILLLAASLSDGGVLTSAEARAAL